MENLNKTYKDVFEEATNYLVEKEIYEAKMSAWYLLEYVTGLSRTQYILHEKDTMHSEQIVKYRELIQKRAEHIPLQYLTNSQEFMGLSFYVNEAVLIPRFDTEVLVEEVIKVSKNKSVFDLCTGSGCIIVSIAALGEIKEAFASDISDKALEVAKKNAVNHQVQINFVQSDMFDNIDRTFDVIVSNPPYIETDEIGKLMIEVKSFEPYHALDGDNDGLKFYRIIAENAGRFLNQDGTLFLEIGYDQGEKVKILLEKNGFRDILIKKDYAGLDRVVVAKRA